MSKKKYKPGDLFLVPLRSGGFGIGIIVRINKSVILGFFWEKKFDTHPEYIDTSELKKSNVFWIKQFSSAGLDIGSWKMIGHYPSFNQTEWGVPRFLREISPFGKYLISYNDNLEEIESIKVDDSFNDNLPVDGVAGYGSIEISLSKYLQEK